MISRPNKKYDNFLFWSL